MEDLPGCFGFLFYGKCREMHSVHGSYGVGSFNRKWLFLKDFLDNRGSISLVELLENGEVICMRKSRQKYMRIYAYHTVAH